MTSKSLIHIGTITGAHGVRGQVKLRAFTADPETLLTYTPLTDATGKRVFKLTRHGIKDNTLIVSIDGITDRNASELLRGTELYAPTTALPKKDNAWSYQELTGLEARLPDGRVYGRITDIHNFGAGDILDIELANGKSEMLPFKNGFVGDVKPDAGFVTVFPPEYVESEDKE